VFYLYKFTSFLIIQYDPVNAAYPASDEALRLVIQKPECKWVSVTNGDNSYGSEVVESILSPLTPKVNLIMLPMDSRNFAAQGNSYIAMVW